MRGLSLVAVWGLLFVAACRLLISVASRVAERRLSGTQASVVAARGLLSVSSAVVAHRLSCSVACQIFLDQGWKQCPLHWQADSYHCATREVLFYNLLKIGNNPKFSEKFQVLESFQSKFPK